MYIRFILACIILCYVGCSSLAVKPANIASYNNGIAIIQEKKAKSKIQVEIAQEIVGGFDRIPLVIYIAIENLHDEALLFSPANISFSINEESISAYDFYNLIRSNLNITQALYDYGIETTPPNNAINDPFFSATAYRPYPVPLWLDGTFFMGYRFYDYSFARASFYTNQTESYNARKFLIAHYLRKNTLHKHDVKGGFILIPYGSLRAGDMQIQVQVGQETYKFLVRLLQNK